MTALEIVQIINTLSPLAEKALSENRDVTQAELESAFGHFGVHLDTLRALIAAKEARGN
jgi:hypothetical protein